MRGRRGWDGSAAGGSAMVEGLVEGVLGVLDFEAVMVAGSILIGELVILGGSRAPGVSSIASLLEEKHGTA